MQDSVKNKLSKEAYELLKLPTLEFNYGPIEFLTEDTIDDGQDGFRYNDLTGEKIDGWTGEEYVIVGFDYSAGCGPDPYIIKADEKDLPVYWLMTDGGDWSNPELISSSLENFNKIINYLSNYSDSFISNILLEREAKEIIEKIQEIEGSDSINDYWSALIYSAVDESEDFNDYK